MKKLIKFLSIVSMFCFGSLAFNSTSAMENDPAIADTTAMKSKHDISTLNTNSINAKMLIQTCDKMINSLIEKEKLVSLKNKFKQNFNCLNAKKAKDQTTKEVLEKIPVNNFTEEILNLIDEINAEKQKITDSINSNSFENVKNSVKNIYNRIIDFYYREKYDTVVNANVAFLKKTPNSMSIISTITTKYENFLKKATKLINSIKNNPEHFDIYTQLCFLINKVTAFHQNFENITCPYIKKCYELNNKPNANSQHLMTDCNNAINTALKSLKTYNIELANIAFKTDSLFHLIFD